jgi:hypothetical protein
MVSICNLKRSTKEVNVYLVEKLPSFCSVSATQSFSKEINFEKSIYNMEEMIRYLKKLGYGEQMLRSLTTSQLSNLYYARKDMEKIKN